jgi:DNA-binding SARP family transcriptional activator
VDTRAVTEPGPSPEPPEPRTRVRLCAPLRLELDGRDLAPGLPGGQASVLLSYLLTRPHLTAARDELIAALWPERPPEDPQANLRPLLSRLRRALAPGRLEGRERLRLVLPEPVWIDVAEASRAVERARVAASRADWADTREHAAAAYEVLRGDLLPGRRHDWLESGARSSRSSRWRRSSGWRAARWRSAARSSRPPSAWAGTSSPGPVPRDRPPLVMEALAASGNVAEALRAYDDVRVLLREELGASPTASCRPSTTAC